MDFLKRNWAVLILIGIVATWVGIRMGTRINKGCSGCIAMDIVLNAIGLGDEDETAKPAEPKPPVAHWSAIDTNGKTVTSAELQGKVSVVVYWATWCGGCKKEIPNLVALREEFPPDKVEIIGLSVDEPQKDLVAYAQSTGINYRIARVTSSIDEAFGEVESIPTLFILDQKGRIQFRHTGVVEHEALSERVRNLLAADKV